MDINTFVKEFTPSMTEYCPVIIDRAGFIYECPEGHLKALIGLSGNEHILNDIPADISPLIYMTAFTESVVVDYENQIYVGELTEEQSIALDSLVEAGLIKKHTIKMNKESMHL